MPRLTERVMPLRKIEEQEALLENQDQLVSYKELARIIGLSERALRKYVALRRIPFKRVGSRTIRFDKSEIRAWLEKRSRMR